jgi:hypothetical protein
MGRKTSVYLDDRLAADVAASGVTMVELLRRGLGQRAPDAGLARLAAELAVLDVADRLGAALAGLRADFAEDVRVVLRGEVADVVRSALRDLQGGGL